MNLLWRMWMGIRFPGVCWKHKRYLEYCSSYGRGCPECVSEMRHKKDKCIKDRETLLRDKYKVHGTRWY